MRKIDLVMRVARKTGNTVLDTKPIVDEVFKSIIANVKAGEAICISGFGVFSKGMSPKRSIIHPISKKRMEVSPKPTPAFRASKAFKSTVRAKS